MIVIRPKIFYTAFIDRKIPFLNEGESSIVIVSLWLRYNSVVVAGRRVLYFMSVWDSDSDSGTIVDITIELVENKRSLFVFYDSNKKI